MRVVSPETRSCMHQWSGHLAVFRRDSEGDFRRLHEFAAEAHDDHEDGSDEGEDRKEDGDLLEAPREGGLGDGDSG